MTALSKAEIKERIQKTTELKEKLVDTINEFVVQNRTSEAAADLDTIIGALVVTILHGMNVVADQSYREEVIDRIMLTLRNASTTMTRQ